MSLEKRFSSERTCYEKIIRKNNSLTIWIENFIEN